MAIDWISVKEGLPQPAKQVAVCNKVTGQLDIGRHTVYGWIDNNSMPINNVSHWAEVELPQ